MALQKAKQELKIEDLQRVRLAPGDVLVVRYEGCIPSRMEMYLQGYLRGLFPNNEILVLDGNVELSVIEAQ